MGWFVNIDDDDVSTQNVYTFFSSEEDVVFKEFTIPHNSMIWGNFWAAHHDETIFTDPWNFRPERFLDENGFIVSSEHICRQS